MNGVLKIKATIRCDTCGCVLHRKKSIKSTAETKEAAIEQANKKIEDWRKSLIGKNCKICQSIIDMKPKEGLMNS